MARHTRHHDSMDMLMAVGSDRLGFEAFSRIVAPLGADGYDGQFYYAIAQAPFKKFGPEIDFPNSRQLRILFPLSGYLASAGQPALLPFAMPLVNLLMVGLMTWLASRFAMERGLNPWAGLALTICLNTTMPFLRNLTDTTAMTMVFWLMFATLNRQSAWMIGVAGLASVLAREQNIAILGLVFAHSLWQRRWAAGIATLAAGLVWAGWVAWLTKQYGELPFLPGKGNFAGPFEGITLAWNLAHERWLEIPEKYHTATYSRLAVTGFSVLVALAVIRLAPRLPCDRTQAGMAMVGLGLWNLTKLPHSVFDMMAVGLHLVMMGLLPVLAWRMKQEQLLPLGMALGGLMLHIIGGPLIYVDYWAYGRAFFWLPMGLWFLAVMASRETLLMWSGVTAFFGLFTMFYR